MYFYLILYIIRPFLWLRKKKKITLLNIVAVMLVEPIYDYSVSIEYYIGNKKKKKTLNSIK